MCQQFVLPVTRLVEGAEHAAVFLAEGLRLNGAAGDRGLDPVVIGGVADVDGQLACMELYILAAADAVELDIAEGDAN